MILASPSGPKLIASRPAVTWEVVPRVRIVAENTAGEVTNFDAVTAVTSSQTDTFTEADLTPSLIVPATFASLDPHVATIAADGRLTWVSNGTARIEVLLGGTKKRFTASVNKATTASGSTVFVRWTDGSAAKHCTDNVEGRIAGLTPSDTTLRIFSTENDANSVYARSASVWCADYHPALTGCNVWQSNWGSGKSRAQTAITPRHIVGAAHYDSPITIGGTQRFVTADGTAVNRTVTHTRKIPFMDIQLSLLNADLPESIVPVSILPTNWSDYFRNLNHNLNHGVPCLLRNQYGEARVFDLISYLLHAAYFTSTMPASREPWRRPLVVGDSGGPAMLMINGTLALITTWTTPILGPTYHAVDWPAEIAALDALAGIDTGYVPNVVDLMPFTDFS